MLRENFEHKIKLILLLLLHQQKNRKTFVVCSLTVGYLDADGAAPPAAVLAFGHGHGAAAQGVKSQDASDTVPDNTHLCQHKNSDTNMHLYTPEKLQKLTWPLKDVPSADLMKSLYTWLARRMTVATASWYCGAEVASRGRAASGMWSWLLDRQLSS